MLQKLRDQTQNTGFKALVIVIIIVLALFGFGATNLFTAPDPELAQIGDYELTQSELALATERERRRIMAQMGTDFDPATLDAQQLSQYVLQQMINRQVVYQTAAALGLRVPDEEVNRQLVQGEAFQVGGRFDEATYRQYVNAMGYSPAEFMAEFGRSLSAETLQGGISNSYLMTDWELAELVRVLNQRRDLAYLPLSVDDYMARVEVTDEEVEIRYEEEASAYMTPLMLDVEYLVLGVQDLMDDESIEVSEEAIASLYDEDRAAALKTEQRDSSHILLQINDERDEAAALAEIEALAQRLAAGEDFAELAQAVSEDPGSAPQGGDLGPVGEGIFDPAFEDALWSLEEPGQISGPVKSAFGYHLIRLNEIVVPEYPSLEEQREQLVARIKRVQAAELFAEQARLLEDLSYDEQTSLADTAAALELPLQREEGVSRDSTHPVLGRGRVISAAFSDEVLAGNNSSAIAMGEEEVIVLRVAEQHPPELKPLEDVRDEVVAAIKREKALAEIDQAKQRGLARLEAGDSVADIAASLNSTWQSYELASRSPRTAEEAAMPTEVRSFAFELPRPPEGEKSFGAVDLATGAALVTVTRVVQGDVDATLAQETDQLRRAASDRGARVDVQSFMQAAEAELGVDRPAAPAG